MNNKKKGSWNSFIHNDNTVGYVFAAPFIIGFCCFTLVPMALSLYYSFCDYKIGSEAAWIGIQNYLNLLVSDLKGEIEEFNILREFKQERIKM